MESKDLIALSLLVPTACAGILVSLFSHRLREGIFFLLVTGTIITQRLDVNFMSHFWYRGTTRGFEVSFIDLLALSVLVGSLVRPRYPGPRWFWPAGLGVMLLYFGYCGISVAMAQPKLLGLFELSKMARGLIVFLAAAAFVRTRRELTLLVLALICTVSFECVWACKQRYLHGLHRVAGTLEHPNSLSMYLCLVTPVIVAAINTDLPRWIRVAGHGAVAGAFITMVLTISRAGIPILGLVIFGTLLWCITARITLSKVAMTVLATVGLLGLLYQSWDTLMSRYGSATLSQEYLDTEGENRGVYLRWAYVIVTDQPLGVGLNNWSYWVSKKYGALLGFRYLDYATFSRFEKENLPTQYFAAPAHNLAALTLGELGIPGLLLLLLMWLRWFQVGATFLRRRIPAPTHRIAVGIFFGLWGLFLQSLTEWTFRQTAILFTSHVLLGVLASLYALKRQAQREAAARSRRPLDELVDLPEEVLAGN